MCGRFSSTTPAAALASYFSVDETLDDEDDPAEPSWNVAPTDRVWAVAERDEVRRLRRLRWGLVPFWSEDPSGGARMINARAEGIADKPGFREAFARGRRCVVPADGFYEWRKLDGGSGKSTKQPWFIHRADGMPMAFAGLYENWRPKDEPEAPLLRTCTIVTTGANAVLRPLHERMPVVLPGEAAWAAWMHRDNDDLAALQGLLVPAPDDLLVAYPVRPLVNSVQNNGPELVEPSPESEDDVVQAEPRLFE